MNLADSQFKLNILNKRAVKVITGLNNFDINYILRVVKAAELGGASYVDISANPTIISFVKSIINLPICVSSIDPIELSKCSMAGADILEIGNFDCFYRQQIFFSAQQILELAQETIHLVKNKIICVTIPHNLLLSEQSELSLKLQELGIQMFQTEGSSTKILINDSNDNNNILNSTTRASAALSSTYTLSQYVQVPIISASSMNLLSSPIAMYYGASVVGIGSALKKYKNISDIANYINAIVSCISNQRNCRLVSNNWNVDLLHRIKTPVNSSILYS